MTTPTAPAAILAQLELLRANNWVPPVRPPQIADTDLPRVGHKIGVGEDEIHAVLDVEAPRGGYRKSGQIEILYEPHVAYRNCSGAIRDKLVAKGLAYPKWGEKPYGDSYAKFTAAFAIAPAVAIMAVSQGRGQLLGEGYVLCGYKSPEEMFVTLSMGGEVEHLEAMVRFIKNKKLDDNLRAHDWPGFAYGYNGSQYAKNGYHTKLKARYEWWAKCPDTPWSPEYVLAEEEGREPTVPAPAPKPTPAPVPSSPEPTPTPTPPAPPVVVSEPAPAKSPLSQFRTLGIDFRVDNDAVSWTAGYVVGLDSEGQVQCYPVIAGLSTQMPGSGYVYFYWRQDYPTDIIATGTLSKESVILAAYSAVTGLSTFHAGVIIDGSKIGGSIDSSKIHAGSVVTEKLALPTPPTVARGPTISGTGAEPITVPAVVLPAVKTGWWASFGRWIDDIFYRD